MTTLDTLVPGEIYTRAQLEAFSATNPLAAKKAFKEYIQGCTAQSGWFGRTLPNGAPNTAYKNPVFSTREDTLTNLSVPAFIDYIIEGYALFGAVDASAPAPAPAATPVGMTKPEAPKAAKATGAKSPAAPQPVETAAGSIEMVSVITRLDEISAQLADFRAEQAAATENIALDVHRAKHHALNAYTAAQGNREALLQIFGVVTDGDSAAALREHLANEFAILSEGIDPT